MSGGGARAERMPWAMALTCALLLAITNGSRQSLGLFVAPLAATGLGVAAVSLILAIGQFWWGAAQPVFGILADRIGHYRVVLLGCLLMAAGFALAPLLPSATGLTVTLGVLSAVGGGAAGFALVFGAIVRRVPPVHQAMTSAVANTGASLGQFVFAPLTSAVLATAGWPIAMWTLAGAVLLTALLAGPALGGAARVEPGAVEPPPHLPVLAMLGAALGDRSYACLHLGFFACGFHIAFLVTHLPGEVAVCGLAPSAAGIAIGVIGLANVAGTLGCGALASRYRMKLLLAAIYAARVAAIAVYLLAPKTLFTLYAFSAVLGLTWLATVPLTAGLVGKLFGPRQLSTLFGLTLLTHQTGAFFGAWLGGVALSMTGSYRWVWYLDMLLAAIAALAHLPVREARIGRPAPAAA